MPTYADDRIGRTIYADNIKLLKLKERRSPSTSAIRAGMRLMANDYAELVERIDTIDSDKIVTPQEKIILKTQWDSLNSLRTVTHQKAEEAGITGQTLYGEYVSAYQDLADIMAIILDPDEIDNDIDLTDLPDLSTTFETYFTKASLVEEQLYQLETGMLNGMDYRVKLDVLVMATENPVKLDGTSSTLSVQLLHNGLDVTADYPSTCFSWYRSTEDAEADNLWNLDHTTTSKTLVVTKNDLVYGYASFICKFQYTYSETMFVQKYGFTTLSIEVPGPQGEQGEAYIVVIESSHGDKFKPGEGMTTTLRPKVFLNGEDITSTIPDSAFRWRRQSFHEPNDDLLWNSNHVAGYRTIEVTANDVSARATFFCDIIM